MQGRTQQYKDINQILTFLKGSGDSSRSSRMQVALFSPIPYVSNVICKIKSM